VLKSVCFLAKALVSAVSDADLTVDLGVSRCFGSRFLFVCSLFGASAAVWSGCDVNYPPDVAPIKDLSVVVGETIVQDLLAVDPDGDPVSFDVDGAPPGAAIERGVGDQWIFTYSPLASHAGESGKQYELVFTASDDRGGATDEHSTLSVLPEGATPRFTGPFAWTLNLAHEDHLTVLIEVLDDDTAHLELTLVKEIEGAVFDQVDGHTASLYWKPRPSQMDEGAVFTFMVTADDGTHATVVADFAVVLVNPEMFGGCPGSPPFASHDPLGDRHGLEDYQVTILADDADSPIRAVECRWSAVKDIDKKDMNTVDLAAGPGGTFSGAITNLSSAGGSGRLVYYHFIVKDNDDQTLDYCDHEVRLPKSGDYAFAVYGPDHPDSCLEDDYGAAAGAQDAAPLPEDAVVPGLRLCGGASDWFEKVLVAGEGLAVVVRPMSASGPILVAVEDQFGGIVAESEYGVLAMAASDGLYRLRVTPADNQPVTYEMTASVMTAQCQADPLEPNDSMDSASTLVGGTLHAVICPSDRDYFGFHLQAGEAASLAITFDHLLADLDISLFEADSSTPIRVSAGLSGMEEVMVEASAPTDYVVLVGSADISWAPYELDLQVEVQDVLCEDDLFSENGTPDQAVMVFEATYGKLKLCPGKHDYFATGLNGAEELTVWVETEVDLDAPPLAILAGDGQTVLADGEIADGLAMADTQVTGPGQVLIRVGPVYGQALPYTMGFSTEEPAGPCQDDRLEYNDSIESAAALPQGITTHLTLCTGDTDIFALKMGAFQTVAAYVLYGSTVADVAIVDQDQVELAWGMPAQYGEEVFYLTKETGTYYLVVEGAGDNNGWYDIILQTD